MAECKSLRESGEILDTFDIALFMASTDDAATNKKFAEANGAKFPVLADPEKQAADAYGVLSPLGFASRWTFYIGADGRILDIDKEVSPVSAGSDIAKRLKRLQIPSATPRRP
jgi:thioredoxin-dependent peroxiredoxin